jgi:hypothetical protein
MNITYQPKVKPNPLPLFAWANLHRGRERIRWKTDGNSLVISFSREVRP